MDTSLKRPLFLVLRVSTYGRFVCTFTEDNYGLFLFLQQAEKNELLKDDDDEIEEEEKRKRKREEQIEKEREERVKNLNEWKVSILHFCQFKFTSTSLCWFVEMQ